MAKGTATKSQRKELQNQPDLSIVIPALNEEKRIGNTLDTLAAFLNKDTYFKQIDTEVIVVAADAPDRTHEIVISKQKLFRRFQLLKPGPHNGKGRDVQYGMLRANGKYVLYMDADLATPLHHLKKFYEECKNGSNLVVGTRNLLDHHPNSLRRLISNIGNILFRIAGGVWIEDSQCGFKMFRKDAAQLCFSKLKIMGWGFDMEILAIAKANKLKIKSLRINDWQDMPYSTFTDDVIKNSLRSLKDLGYITLNRLRGVYS